MIGLKELRETIRWIKLARQVPLIDEPKQVDELVQENDELIRIFVTSLRTARNKATG